MFTLIDKSIEFREKITFSIAVDGLTDYGIQQIHDLLLNYSFRQLPDDWAWTWLVTGKGEYVGTLPKRISKYYYQLGVRLSPETLSQIGNIASAHNLRGNVSYTFDVTDTIDWRKGDYGDTRSCYWRDHSAAKDIIMDNNAGAVRFFDENGNGIARAWIVPNTPREGTFIIFNGYGFKPNATLVIARTLAIYFGVSYKKIALSNNGSDTNTVYINGDKGLDEENGHGSTGEGIGYLIGSQDKIDSIARYDLNWEDNSHTCYDCGCSIDEYDMYTDDWHEYCDQCYWERYATCDNCGETIDRDYAQYHDGESYCEHCFSRNFSACDNCGEMHHNDDMHYVDGEEVNVCERCYDHRVRTCEICERDFYRSHMTGELCGDCHELHVNSVEFILQGVEN